LKESILAQKIAYEFIARFPMLAPQFNPAALAPAVLGFLKAGEDSDDRAAAVGVALARAHRRSSPESVIADAQEILDWPPKPKPVAEKKKPRPKARGARKKR
jgi:hypothetical protein